MRIILYNVTSNLRALPAEANTEKGKENGGNGGWTILKSDLEK